MSNAIISRRLDELFEEASELAYIANAEMLTYLIDMAKLELHAIKLGDDSKKDGPRLRATRQK